MRKTFRAALAAALIVASVPDAAVRAAGQLQTTGVVPTVTLTGAQGSFKTPSLTAAAGSAAAFNAISLPGAAIPAASIPSAKTQPAASGAKQAPGAIASAAAAAAAAADPKADPKAALNAAFDASASFKTAAAGVFTGTPGPAAASGLDGFDKGSGKKGPQKIEYPEGEPKIRDILKARAARQYERFLHLLRDTAAEILILGTLGLGLGLYIGHDGETDRGKSIPLGFSEIHQIERDAARQGKEVGHVTRYLTGVNDLTMKVFESWNESWENTYYGDNTHDFARELEKHMEPTFKFHRYEAFDYFRDLPSQSDSALAALHEYTTARDRIAPVNSAFSASWDESHVDHYRTEYYTHHWTDSKGKSHSERRSRRVYDYTRHSYDYHKDQGENASKLLDRVLADTKAPALHEDFLTASQTNAEGEYAAEKSRKKNDPDLKLGPDDYKKIAGTWLTGSTLKLNLPMADQAWNELPADADAWRRDKGTARSDSYRTHSRSDSGPAEFRTAQSALSDGSGYAAAVDEVTGAIKQTKADLPSLEEKVRRLIDQELNYGQVYGEKKQSSSSLMSEIMDESREIYARNFKHGFDVDPYRGWMVAIWGFALALAGAALGKALDYFGGRKGWYDKLLSRLRDPLGRRRGG
jgi:hypothetical protein